MAWVFGLTDLDGVPLGRLHRCTERKLFFPLNGLPTASFTIRLDDPLAAAITSRLGDVLLKAYYNSTLLFIGEATTVELVGPLGELSYRVVIDREGLVNQAYSLPPDFPTSSNVRWAVNTDSVAARGLFEEVIPSDLSDGLLRQALAETHVAVRKQPKVELSFQPSGSEATLSANFAGPLWRLVKRLTGKTTEGLTFTNVDRADIVKQLLIDQNLTGGDTGIRVGSIATLQTTNAGPWSYKPVAEAVREISSTQEVVYFAREDFAGAGGVLEARTPNIGPVWSTQTDWGFGTSFAPDWGTQTGRGNQSESAWARAVFGTTTASDLTATRVSALIGTEVTSNVFQGLTARYVDNSNEVLAYVEWNAVPQRLFVKKVVADVETTLASAALTSAMAVSNFYRVTLETYADGSGYASVHNIYGELMCEAPWTADSVLLSPSGALYKGRAGLRDIQFLANAGTRWFDDVTVSVPGNIQGFDFELAPSEPTADTNQSGVVGAGLQIASLNIAQQIGTTKANVIFDGNSSPHFPTDYIVGDTVTARAKLGSDIHFNDPVRVRKVDVSIDDLGKETIAPSLRTEE